MYSNNGFFDDFGGKYVAEVLRRPLDELEKAMEIFCVATKLAAVNKILENM